MKSYNIDMDDSKDKKEIDPEMEEYLDQLEREQFEREMLEYQMRCDNYDFERGDVIY